MAFSDEILAQFSSLGDVRPPRILRACAWMLCVFIVCCLLLLFFVPWVQTAYGTGVVTALNPNDRPQPINALVSGRIKQWFVEEGSVVRQGDALLEIIDNDAHFIQRLEAKRDSLQSKLDAARANAKTALLDVERQRALHEQGLSAKRTYEQARIKLNVKRADIAKAEAELNKAKVMLAQQDMQIIRAPRDGTIVKIMAGDNATTVQMGDQIARFAPAGVTPAVELFVDGNDVPLIQVGRKVRLQFEGWPVVQFSGWPAKAVGTFGGVVQSIDPFVSVNGRFRIIIVADPNDTPWPEERFLRMGANVRGWVLLETVKVGFELWRNLNNFPPELPRQSTNKMAQ